MNIAAITGASSGLGVKFLDVIIRKYPNLDAYWIIARRIDRLEALAKKYPSKKIVPSELGIRRKERVPSVCRREVL